MCSSGNNHYLLVPHHSTLALRVHASHLLESVFAEIAAVRLLAVHQQHRSLYLCGPGQQRLVEKRLCANQIPAVGTVAATLVIATGTLIISMIERVILFNYLSLFRCEDI